MPFGALHSATGYLAEHGPVIHTLSSERDLVPEEARPAKQGLLVIGNPAFPAAEVAAGPGQAGLGKTVPDATGDAAKRGAAWCMDLRTQSFHPLVGSGIEAADIATSWRRWTRDEREDLATGEMATRELFLKEAGEHRVLHMATHAFLMDSRCGNGNPLLNSGLVFAGDKEHRQDSILTAQQIASMDLSGVDWAVLSACNTGNGELRDGEGVMGLQRAFRIAGARSVVMTLWPVDDEVTREFMHKLYEERLGRHASTANAVWRAERGLLLERRAAGKSTHPWYWAGFVGSGGWE
jgi:CHAT domain-containing protein